MLRKILMSSTLLAALATPMLAAPAQAYVQTSHVQHGLRHDVRTSHYRHRHQTAWEVVRHDRCLSARYRRFAANHKNPVKRQHFIERIAREGCSHRYHS